MQTAHEVVETLRARLRAAIVGRDKVIDWVLVALLADGHVLLEDYPGSGKTTLAKALGTSITAADAWPSFRRVQFTPDLLPSDITGTTIFNVDSRTFSFRPGPTFTHVLLADEINRTSPKVQSALLEAMGEGQVTVDNETHRLDPLFFVIATQNPIDLAGTYPLPTPQLDRFLFKLRMEPIAEDPEMDLLQRYPVQALDAMAGLPQVSRDALLAARAALREHVALDPALRKALVALAQGLRQDPRTVQGPSTRALLLALPALQAHALLEGRNYVLPADIAALTPVLLSHRIVFRDGPEAASEVLADQLAPVMETLAKLALR